MIFLRVFGRSFLLMTLSLAFQQADRVLSLDFQLFNLSGHFRAAQTLTFDSKLFVRHLAPDVVTPLFFPLSPLSVSLRLYVFFLGA